MKVGWRAAIAVLLGVYQTWQIYCFVPPRFSGRIQKQTTTAAHPVNAVTDTLHVTASKTRLSLFEGLKNLVSSKDSSAQLAEVRASYLQVISRDQCSWTWYFDILQENDVVLKDYTEKVEKINALEEDIERLSNDELIAKTQQFRDRFALLQSHISTLTLIW